MLDEEFKKATLEEFKKIDSRFDIVESDISELKSDVSELKSDVFELKSDVSGLKTDVKELKYEFSDMKSILLSVTNSIIKLEHTVDSHYTMLCATIGVQDARQNKTELDIETMKKESKRMQAENEIRFAVMQKRVDDYYNKKHNKNAQSNDLKVI